MKSIPAIHPAITDNTEDLLDKHAPHIDVKAIMPQFSASKQVIQLVSQSVRRSVIVSQSVEKPVQHKSLKILTEGLRI